jgi:hypothetical protein
MKQQPIETRPLGIGSPYRIAADGRVFRAHPTSGLRPLQPLTIARAREEATKSPTHRDARRPEAEALVSYEAELWAFPNGRILEGPPVPHVETVVFPPLTRTELGKDPEECPGWTVYMTWNGGGWTRAVGDVTRDWFVLDLPNAGRMILHGPSTAARLFQSTR